MTGPQMQYHWGILARDTELKDILSDEIFYWINLSIETIIKSIFGPDQSGLNQFELSQKIKDDLQSIIVSSNRTPITIVDASHYTVTLPTDYWFKVRETAEITYTNCKKQSTVYDTDVVEANMNNIDPMLWNPYSEHILRFGKARPIRLQYNDKMELITDGNYSVTKYVLYYIQKPAVVSPSVSCNLPSETHEDIVTMAYTLCIANRRIKSPQATAKPNQ